MVGFGLSALGAWIHDMTTIPIWRTLHNKECRKQFHQANPSTTEPADGKEVGR